MKRIRNVYALTGLIIIIVIVVMSIAKSNKTTTKKQVNPNGYSVNKSQNSSVDSVKLQQVKAAFPPDFPLLNDADVTHVFIDDVGNVHERDIWYSTNKETSEIISTYTVALKAQGLNVDTRDPSRVNGYKYNPQYSISVSVQNQPNGGKLVVINLGYTQ